jgi:hypothetical protein
LGLSAPLKKESTLPSTVHPAASAHLPWFITAPGQTDYLTVIVAILLVGSVLGVGVFFFWLHSLPERMVHNKIQFDLVAVLALLSLFTHIHAFWVAALLLALVDLPKFSLPHFGRDMGRIASSLDKIASSTAVEASAARSASVAAADPAATEIAVGKPVTAPTRDGLGSAPAETSKPHAAEHGA